MLDKNALKAEMVRNGFTQSSLSKELGISPRTFSNRLKSEDFGRNEIEKMIELLHIKNPVSIFFKP